MPQLDPTSFPSQLFWLVMSFVVLYILLAWLLLPRVQSVLLTRKQTMQNDVDQAEEFKSQAARAESRYEKDLAQARAMSQEMLAQAHAQASAQSAKRRAEMDAMVESRLMEANEAIRNAKQGIAAKLTPMAGDLASLIVETLVHEKPDSRDIGNAISEVSREKSL